MLSVPVYTRTMLPNGHCNIATFSSVMRRTSPIFRLLTSSLHFFLSSKDGTYSLFQRFQKSRRIFWMCAHLIVALQLATYDFFGFQSSERFQFLSRRLDAPASILHRLLDDRKQRLSDVNSKDFRPDKIELSVL